MQVKFIAAAVTMLVVSMNVFSQQWNALNWALYGRNAEVSVNLGWTWSSNPDRSIIAVRMGSYVFISIDSARSFIAVDLPIKRSFYGPHQAVVAEDSVMYITSQDLPPGFTWIVTSTNQGRNWNVVRLHSDTLFDGSPLSIHVASGPLLIVESVENRERSYLSVSTDRGQSWHDKFPIMYDDPEYQSLVFDRNFRPVGASSPKTHYILDPKGAIESSDSGQSWYRAPIPPNTGWYRYLGDSVVLAQVRTSEDAVRLLRSTNRGSTWTQIDTVRFVNSDRSFVPGFMHEVRRDGSNAHATFRFRSGTIVSTTDAGASWIYRGQTLSDNDFNDVEREMSTFLGHGTIIPQQQDYFVVVPEGSFSPISHIRNVPSGIPVQISDSVYLVSNLTALFKSVDGGESWFILEREIQGFSGIYRRDDIDLQRYEAQCLWWGQENQLSARAQYDVYGEGENGQYRLHSPRHFLIQCPIGSEYRWCYSGIMADAANTPISESNFLQPSAGMPSPVLVRVTIDNSENNRAGVLDLLAFKGQKERSTVRRRTHYAWQVRSGEVLLMADSLLISADTGQSWRALPSSGLPLDSAGNIATVTSFCEGPNGEWYMGLSGAVIMSAEVETGREPGGVVRSRDRGQTWQRLSGFPEPTHVFHVACDGTGVVFASTTQRSYGADRPTGRKEQDYMSQVFRIFGDTAELSYSEYLSGSPTKAGRVLRRDQRGAMLYASMYEGLKRSTDGGLSWHQVGNDALDTMTIKDVVVARDNKLYVGTTIGVYESNALTSGIEQEEDASRRPTIWCYPTPAATSLRIHLNNVDPVIGTAPKLILCTIKGEEVLNFSEDVRRCLGSKRTEFDADVSNLTPGIYALVLQAGKSSSFHKVLILH